MSGHSKWAQIKRQKQSADEKRGQLFSKLARTITLACREGGTDPDTNFKLRMAIDKARASSMPNDNIQRAISRASGGESGGLLEEITYEGYGPFGTAFLIEAATDNKNRTVNNLKHIFSKHGGSLSGAGSVSWQFAARGQILVERSGSKELSDIELAAIDAGAEDVRESAEGLEIYTAPLDLHAVKNKVLEAGGKIAQAEIIKESTRGVELAPEQKKQIEALLSELEDDDDVIAVHTSANL
jgi:YebC/PmpR family DNA-binding regulatory protein